MPSKNVQVTLRDHPWANTKDIQCTIMDPHAIIDDTARPGLGADANSEDRPCETD
jgi:hypothetical protein